MCARVSGDRSIWDSVRLHRAGRELPIRDGHRHDCRGHDGQADPKGGDQRFAIDLFAQASEFFLAESLHVLDLPQVRLDRAVGRQHSGQRLLQIAEGLLDWRAFDDARHETRRRVLSLPELCPHILLNRAARLSPLPRGAVEEKGGGEDQGSHAGHGH